MASYNEITIVYTEGIIAWALGMILHYASHSIWVPTIVAYAGVVAIIAALAGGERLAGV